MNSTRTRRSSNTTISGSGKLTPATSSASVPQRGGHHPLFVIAVGVGFLILFLIALLAQIQTNEAFITHHGSVDVFHPNWQILFQLPLLAGSQLSSGEAAAAIFGWSIELIYLGFIVGYEIVMEAAHISGRFMGGLFKTGAWVIVCFNWWTDFNYGTIGSGTFGHIAFACAMSFIVGFFGTIGIFLIRYGWGRA
jgi:hypothetical protein